MQKTRIIHKAAAICLAALFGIALFAQRQETCPTCNGTGKVAASGRGGGGGGQFGGGGGSSRGGGIAAQIQQGEKRNLKFGPYEWRVLETRRDRALIITEKSIESRRFHNDAKSFPGWDNSEIRQYLNGAFIQAFSRNDQNLIIKSRDTVFLLSVAECNKFSDNKDRTPGGWWLRTNGAGSDKVAYVNSGGAITGTGWQVNFSQGVRPALWISLQ
jgi:hypothetical protein